MKKTYETPTIIKQIGGVTNKFGLSQARKYQSEIDGVHVADLVAQYGSPLFVYSEKTIVKKHRELMNAFSLRYSKVKHAWSYKTNYLRSVCHTFHRLGSKAEVVSMMEYEMAKRLGVSPGDIIFNGPHKPYSGLKKALEEGAYVNVDNFDELQDVERIGRELKRPVEVGLRFNMSLGSQMSWDRYGFNLESGAAMQAIKQAVIGGVRIRGFHSHIGTFVCETDFYRTAVSKLIDFHRIVRGEYGIELEYLDMGGGFASRNRLKGTYLSTSDAVPSFDRYAEAICQPLLDSYGPDEQPFLILESGRAMIDEAGTAVATVTATRRLQNGKRALVIDAGVNVLFTSFWYDHEIVPVQDKGASLEDQVIYGPLCMQIDVIRDSIRLPSLERGDHLLIKPVGAYNNTQWMQFITLRPSIVMISQRGEVSVIRRAETVDDLQLGESLPTWLQE